MSGCIGDDDLTLKKYNYNPEEFSAVYDKQSAQLDSLIIHHRPRFLSCEYSTCKSDCPLSKPSLRTRSESFDTVRLNYLIKEDCFGFFTTYLTVSHDTLYIANENRGEYVRNLKGGYSEIKFLNMCDCMFEFEYRIAGVAINDLKIIINKNPWMKEGKLKSLPDFAVGDSINYPVLPN